MDGQDAAQRCASSAYLLMEEHVAYEVKTTATRSLR